ncbi:hypothetical protein KCU67_g7014, partial [Aureobasidium melanogenum]
MDNDDSNRTPKESQPTFCKVSRAEMRKVKLSLVDMHHRLYTLWVTLRDKKIDPLLQEWEVINAFIQKSETVFEDSTPERSNLEQETPSPGWNDFLLDCGIEKTIRGLVSKLPEIEGFSASTMTTFLKTFALGDLTEVRAAVKQEINRDPDFVDDFEMKLRKFVVVFFCTKLQTQMVEDLVKEFVQI